MGTARVTLEAMHMHVFHMCAQMPQTTAQHTTTQPAPFDHCNVCEIFSLQTSYFSFLVCFEPYTKNDLRDFQFLTVSMWDFG